MQHIRRKTLPQVFDVVRMASTKEEKVRILKAYKNRDMLYVINGLYNVDWSDLPLPDIEAIDNQINTPEMAYSSINKSLERIEKAYILRKTKPELSRRLIEMVLKEVSKEEHDLLIRMFKGKKIDGITRVVFKEAFPEFFRTE